MKLSIVMPVFNNTDKVKIMIDSILANDFQDWELWAVDDGSEEDTLQLLYNYNQNDARIHYCRRNSQPKGAQTCRNIGINRSQGEYIIFFDSDDYITPNCLSTRVCHIEKHPDMDFMIFPSGVLINDKYIDKHNASFGHRLLADDVAAFAQRNLPFVVVNVIFRRSAIANHHLTWDTKLLSRQDADFNLQAIASGLHYEYVNTANDYYYRIGQEGNNSISQKMLTEPHIKSMLYAMEKFYRTITSVYGYKYKWSLYEGAIRMLLPIIKHTNNIFIQNACLAIVNTYTPFCGKVLACQLHLFRLLSIVIPCDKASYLPFAINIYRMNRYSKLKNHP